MSKLNPLHWIEKAKEYLGLKENKSKTAHNPTILAMLEKMGSFNGEEKSWWKNDEEAWCGLFVGYILGTTGRYVIKKWYRAKEWSLCEGMRKLNSPAVGAVAVFKLPTGHHVGFIVGKTASGDLVILGGNQSDSVKYSVFKQSAMIGAYWPAMVGEGNTAVKSQPNEGRYNLPILTASGQDTTR